MLRDMIVFAGHQEKATLGPGYKLTLTRNTDNAVLKKDNAIYNAKTKIRAIEWYVPHYTHSISKQAILSQQILSKAPTKLQYVERSVFMKEVNTQKLWSCELGAPEGKNVHIWIIVGFQQKDRQNSQSLNNDTFYRPSVTSAQCVIGTEKKPDSGVLLNYDDDSLISKIWSNSRRF